MSPLQRQTDQRIIIGKTEAITVPADYKNMTQIYLIYCQASQAQQAQDDKKTGYFLVAAQVDTLIGLDQRIHQHLQKQSWAFVYSHDNPSTVTQYLQDKPQHQTTVDELCAQLSPENPIVLARLDEAIQPENNYLIIDNLDAVEPLDGQFGVHPRKNVPDALQQPLFGQPEPTAADIEHYGELDQVPPLKTYLVIDAARIMHGASIISGCDLPYRCLFKGAVAEDLKDVAPYLIELDSEADFTRTLFTYHPDFADNHSTIHLWHKEPGIYIRSRASFDTLYNHLRKYTRIQDDKDKWFYFRFWEPQRTLSLLQGFGFQWSCRFLQNIAQIITPCQPVSIISLSDSIEVADKSAPPFRLTTDHLDNLAAATQEQFILRVAQQLNKNDQHLENGQNSENTEATVREYTNYLLSAHYTDEATIEAIIEFSLEHDLSVDTLANYQPTMQPAHFTDKERFVWLKNSIMNQQQLFKIT